MSNHPDCAPPPTQTEIINTWVDYHIKQYYYLKSRGIVLGKKSKIIRLKANIMGYTLEMHADGNGNFGTDRYTIDLEDFFL